jgi:hypothetical protein
MRRCLVTAVFAFVILAMLAPPVLAQTPTPVEATIGQRHTAAFSVGVRTLKPVFAVRHALSSWSKKLGAVD